MTRFQKRLAIFGMFYLMAFAGLPALDAAETIKLEGVIIGRSGAMMILQTPDSPNLVVLLTDTTKVGQLQGLLKARKKEMSMAALIPGLAVRVEGFYDEENQLVAKSVSFKGNDLERAQSIQAGLHQTQVQAQQNKQELEEQQARLEAQKEALAQQQQRVTQQQEELTTQQKKIAENKEAIEAAIARFGQLDDYYILDELTVHFDNGKTTFGSEYQPKLMQLAEKAKTIEGYMIQIIGYASSTGSAAMNQKLSEDRANNVANFLLQQAHLPLTNMLAPGAMGESEQVGEETTAEGQAENRRVVIRVLQNKGVAGR